MAELLDLDGEVLHNYLAGVIAWVAGRATPLPAESSTWAPEPAPAPSPLPLPVNFPTPR